MTEEERREIIHNVEEAKRKIAAAAIAAGHRPEDITLVAATKMNGAERVRAAVEAGVDVCGENRVQELLEKYEQHAYDGKPLHFIGTLQSNKVKYLMGKVSLIESVSSIKLARVIDKEAAKAGICQDILLEVNIGREESKLGIDPDELFSAAEEIAKLEHVHVRGLMAIPPKTQLNEEKTLYFDRMSQLFIDISAKKYDNIAMDYLSMGMSADYCEAISCGATIVRLGTAIFGARQY
ncbi:MAG: YggS family pyridoxal phosphate-dependent enzyme [Eubacteriales bacterium]|nr:YggS family pyridoxal phosphate-dependent enzyme [Eubacteriales bacterium]